jgi:hypothetical protein
MLHLESFDNGKRALLVLRLKKAVIVDGKLTEHVGCVLEEKRLLELVHGLNDVADMRKAVQDASRIIIPH